MVKLELKEYVFHQQAKDLSYDKEIKDISKAIDALDRAKNSIFKYNTNIRTQIEYFLLNFV